MSNPVESMNNTYIEKAASQDIAFFCDLTMA